MTLKIGDIRGMWVNVDGKRVTGPQVRQALAGTNAVVRIFAGKREVLRFTRQLAQQRPVSAVADMTTGSAGLLRQIEALTMVPISKNVRIMRDEVTVGLFRQVMRGYVPKGYDADRLQAILNCMAGADDPLTDDPLTYVNLFDAREFAKRLSVLINGRKLRVPTEAEWMKARNQLSGSNWTWTETQDSVNDFVLRHLCNSSRGGAHPEHRYDNLAVRLVEDIKPH